MKKGIAKFLMSCALVAMLPIAGCNENQRQSSSIVNRSYTGQGEPKNELGVDGDTYTDTETNNIYKKENGAWVLISNQSPKSYSGEGEPNEAMGNNGDKYTNTVNGAIYEKQNGKWVVIQEGDQLFVVSFNLNGGRFIDGSTTYPSQTVRIGRWATEPAMEPFKEHCSFEGWFANGSDTKWNFVGTGVYGNVELVAKYKVDEDSKIIVTVDPNNGQPSYQVETFIGDYLYPSAPTKSGYAFVGWYIKSTGEKFNGTVTASLSDEILIAQFEKAKFNVAYQVEANDEITITDVLDVETVSLEIPNVIGGRKVTKISKAALNSLAQLQNVYIPANVKEIEPGFLRDTMRMTSITVDSANLYYTSVDGILYSKNMETLVAYPTKAGTSYTMPNSVKYIGAYAFYDSKDNGIKSINFSNQLVDIGDYAFAFNETLQSLALPKTLKRIGKYAFWGPSFSSDDDPDYSSPQGMIQNAGLPEGLEIIDDGAFVNQYFKDTFALPSTVKYIGEYAFANCTAIVKLILPKDLETIGYNAFSGCTGILETSVAEGNTHFKAVDKIIYSYDMKTLVMCPSGRRDKVTVPEGVTALGDCAFYMVDELQEYEFPSTLKSFGKECFSFTYNLSKFVIPDSVTEIGISCFDRSGVSEITIGKGLTYLPKYAFAECKISKINIPGNVKVIGESAFQWCSRLKEITLGEGIEEIQYSAFASCSISSLNMPNSLKKIGDAAFNGNSIKELVIKAGLEELGADVFNSATVTNTSAAGTTIETITVASSNKFSATGNVLFSKDGKTLYMAAKTVGADDTTFVVPNGVETIYQYAFAYSQIKSFSFPSSLKEIGEAAFNHCKASTLSFGSSLKKIGDGAFYYGYMTSITFAEGLEEIGEGAFRMTDLKSVTLPNSLKKIGAVAFSQCLQLKEVNLGTGIEEIGEEGFSNCRIENTIKIGAKCTKLGTCAFGSTVSTYGNQITDFQVDANNPNYKSQNGFILSKDGKIAYNFAGGYDLETNTMTIPNGVEEIADFGCSGCAALITTVKLPTSLKKIGAYGFYSLQYVDVLTIPSSVTFIGKYAFAYWNNKQSLRFGLSEDEAYSTYEQGFLYNCSARVSFGSR